MAASASAPAFDKARVSRRLLRRHPQLVALERRHLPRLGAGGAHRLCHLAQLGLLRARLCPPQDPLRRAADVGARRLRPGGAHAQLQSVSVALDSRLHLFLRA